MEVSVQQCLASTDFVWNERNPPDLTRMSHSQLLACFQYFENEYIKLHVRRQIQAVESAKAHQRSSALRLRYEHNRRKQLYEYMAKVECVHARFTQLNNTMLREIEERAVMVKDCYLASANTEEIAPLMVKTRNLERTIIKQKNEILQELETLREQKMYVSKREWAKAMRCQQAAWQEEEENGLYQLPC